MVGGTTPPQSDSGEISRVLVLNLLWQSKRCSRTAQDISVLTTPSLLSRGTLQFLFPRIDQPQAGLLTKFRSEVKTNRRPHIFEAVSQRNFWRRTTPFLILEFAPVESDQLKKSRHETMWQGNLEMISPLRSHDPLAVHDELVPFGLTAENRMIRGSSAAGTHTFDFQFSAKNDLLSIHALRQNERCLANLAGAWFFRIEIASNFNFAV